MTNFKVKERVQFIEDGELRIGTIYSLDDKLGLAIIAVEQEEHICKCFKYISEITKLDQPEPVVVPEDVGELISHYESIFSGRIKDDVLECLLQAWNNEYFDTEVLEWVDDNLIKFMEAVRNGYVVDDTKYIVRVGESLLFQRFNGTRAVFIVDNKPGAEELAKVFDIKKEAESVAEPIGGIVEEVE